MMKLMEMMTMTVMAEIIVAEVMMTHHSQEREVVAKGNNCSGIGG